jgi:type IV pilus assembly protein PilB
MKLDDKKIGEILLKGNYITIEDLKESEKAFEEKNLSLIDYLFSVNLLTKDLLGQALAEFFEVSYADLNSRTPSREQVLRIPIDIAQEFRVILFSEDQDKIVVATDNPLKEKIEKKLSKLFPDKNIEISFSLEEDIDIVLRYYQQTLNTRFADIIKKQKRVAPEIIEEIFEDALSFRASDIHFEPQEEEIVIRFRVDGILYEAGRIPKEYYENILNRIKVQSNLRIDEHFSAQDGAIRYKNRKGEVIDLRISIAPIIEGEKIVVRLLSEYTRSFNLGELGLSNKYQNIIERVSKKPYGIILNVGPTGSGKTTTLYSIIKTLNRLEKNITTIEDPVEYKITGINQIQVNPQTNLTYSRGLKSIIRQDPDIILVGEIRDNETAEIAVNAALTGHLLFSTFHANDIATVIPRLLDMKVEPFLLSSTLEVIIAQRLVRKICESCRYSIELKRSELEQYIKNSKKYFPEEKITIYQGKGCKQCSNTKYRGRTGIFEIIEISKNMRELILKNPSASQVWELAKKEGVVSMFEDGIDKVRKGITTIEELIRVAEPHD